MAHLLPTGMKPYLPPVADVLHSKLTLILFALGFMLSSWLLIYQLTTKKEERSLVRELMVVVFSSISSSDSSFVGSVMLHVACRVVACFLVLDCVSRSNLLSVIVSFDGGIFPSIHCLHQFVRTDL